MSFFTELPRSHVRLGVAGKIMTAAQARETLAAGADYVLIGRAAILHHDYPQKVAADPGFEPIALPVSRAHLAAEGLSPTFYLQRTALVLSFDDVWLGLAKPVVFAFLIAVIGCYNGLNARGGADGVGKATTNTVYVIAISVLISDFFITKLFLAL